MKKLLVALVYAFERAFNINGIVTKTFREEKARRNHNSAILQNLLDCEHGLRDLINTNHNEVFTTKKAIEYANKIKFASYNSHRSLQEADFR